MKLLRAGMCAGALALGLGAVGMGAAQAGTSWTVAVGEQAPAPKTAPKGSTLNEFLPAKLTIAAGDSVTFGSASFHTVTYLGKLTPPELFLPDPKKSTYTGIKDAAGADFAFNGMPKFIYNGAAFAPMGGKAIDGTAPVSSGVLSPAGPKQKVATATYAFPKAGSYHLICTVHPGMAMDVVVKPAGTALPATPTQVKAEALKEQAAGWARVTAAANAAKPPAATIYMGIGDADTALAFFPKALTVKAGTTVRFVNRSPREPHNATFGPVKWIEGFSKKTDLLPFGPTAPNQVTPVFLYGSDPKGKNQVGPTTHGNGFYASSLTVDAPKMPLPRAVTVTFTTPGTYHYICLLHGPDMSGTVVVTK